MPESNSVYVVDNDRVVLDSLYILLSEGGYSVHCFTNGVEFVDDSDLYQPGCLISNVQLPQVSGTELLRRLRELKSPISVITGTDAADVPLAVTLMDLGAVTLLQQPYDEAKLLDVVPRALAISEQRWQKTQVDKSLVDRLRCLSEEEEAVMRLMLTGAPIKSISWRLHLSERTVDRRRQSVLKKMQVSSLLELALLMARVD